MQHTLLTVLLIQIARTGPPGHAQITATAELVPSMCLSRNLRHASHRMEAYLGTSAKLHCANAMQRRAWTAAALHLLSDLRMQQTRKLKAVWVLGCVLHSTAAGTAYCVKGGCRAIYIKICCLQFSDTCVLCRVCNISTCHKPTSCFVSFCFPCCYELRDTQNTLSTVRSLQLMAQTVDNIQSHNIQHSEYAQYCISVAATKSWTQRLPLNRAHITTAVPAAQPVHKALPQ